ncbi:MAG: hypothetical protein IPJ03_02250 [Ignavibacteriales bacterium]|nr:hypothetical protein [Ignavibacteriales bacterium]
MITSPSTYWKAFFLFCHLNLLNSFLFFFINKPFNKISLSLTTNDPALLKSLISKKDEFGNIVALLIQHFQLQEKIIKEINEKHIIEKACATAKNFIDQFCWLLKMLLSY